MVDRIPQQKICADCPATFYSLAHNCVRCPKCRLIRYAQLSRVRSIKRCKADPEKHRQNSLAWWRKNRVKENAKDRNGYKIRVGRTNDN